MKINTYFDTTYLGYSQGEIIRLWRDSWRRRGWEPRILNPRTFAHHPRRKEFLRKAKGVTPSFNSIDYYRLVRWLALAEAGGGWFCDYDVMNFDFRVPSRCDERHSRSYSEEAAFGYLSHEDALRVVKLFLDSEHFLRDHELLTAARIYQDRWPKMHVALGEDGWRDARTVHFGTEAIRNHYGFFVLKHRAIDACGRTA